ncbi:hypothetical protein EON83_14905 [bacterium]|nr:MAG: hypothetical protein EON83_14905 [bacterium]
MKSQRATLIRVQLIDIHGQKYYDLTFTLDSKPEAPKTSRIGAESVYSNPQEGDAIEVGLILGQLTSVKKAENTN